MKLLKPLELLLLVQTPSPFLSFQLLKLLPQLKQFRQLKPLDTINLFLPVQPLKPLKPRLKPPRSFPKIVSLSVPMFGTTLVLDVGST